MKTIAITIAATLALGAFFATQADADGAKLPKPVPIAILGPAGPAGTDGINGRDGIDGLAAIATLQTRTPIKGQWTGAFGLSGDANGADGVALGARYGISDRSDVYVVIGQSFDGDTSWGVGATFILGGGN